ncbi:hypothetical protein B0J12DRAFT_294425 [Macrophomina phaseolina]|uniref:Zn(2)-C6 fungal-type domain-containing protein n=1 Tax=Macrophomina phaseolina TaxID=35725 RepID=A0ABQ8GNT2_9PEZI|nr:hypothetical protein B0J12DRAFT_294425 [Macrophomina phaseolina]
MSRPLVPLEAASSTEDTTTVRAPSNAQKRKRPNGILAVACLACQKRKTKCDGGRPSCRTCSSKKATCVYDAPEGQTRIAALKIRNSDLQDRLTSSVNLLWSLKTLPAEEAAQILERIRSSNDPSAVLDSFSSGSTGSKRPRSPDSSISPATSDHRTPQPPPAKRSNRRISISETDIRPADLFPNSSRDPPAYTLLRSPACRDAFQYFIKCTGVLFHIFTKEQGDRAFDDIMCNAESAVSKLSMCEVCASAAVGSQYSQGKVPAHVGHQFYDVARHLLDDAIQLDPLRGMKICALLAMYNIVIKGSVAFAYIEMGIGLGVSKGLPLGEAPPGISAELWLDYKKVWTTLLCFKGWLVATLGYYSWDDWMEKIIESRATIAEEGISTTESIKVEMTRLAILKAKIFQTTFVFSEISTDAINKVRAELRRWYEQLDPCMQLAQLSKNTTDLNFRRGIYLVHCLHLGGMILVQRRIFQNYAPAVRADPELADRIVHELSDPIEEGFTAAIACARILDLVHRADGIFQRCWLCVFQSYISTVEILFMTTQKLLHNYPKVECVPDLAVASKSLAVLKFCAETDHIARDLAGSLQAHYDLLTSLTNGDKDRIDELFSLSPPEEAAVAHSSLPWETLLKLPPGESQLHETSRQLMAQLCNPFANMKNITKSHFEGPAATSVLHVSSGTVEEYTLGAHLEWSTETVPPKRGTTTPAVRKDIVANVNDGFFINSAEPCGWTFGGSYCGSTPVSE